MSKSRTEYKEAKDIMTEAEVKGTIIEAAQARGWMAYSVPDSRLVNPRKRHPKDELSGNGFPDLVLLKLPYLVFVEAKGERGVVSPDQKRWLESLRQVGDGNRMAYVFACVVHPGRIDNFLGWLDTFDRLEILRQRYS